MVTKSDANVITLNGSTDIVARFFEYAVNSIIYQRGIYPPEMFKPTVAYGITVMVASDPGLVDYMSKVMAQMKDWLLHSHLQKLVLVVASVASGEVMERWTFDVHADAAGQPGAEPKPESQITAEIQAIIRQITASVTFLPLLTETCSFDLLVYTDKNTNVPGEWEDSDARIINDAADVKLRSFNTKVHKVDALVSYKTDVLPSS